MVLQRCQVTSVMHPKARNPVNSNRYELMLQRASLAAALPRSICKQSEQLSANMNVE